MKLSPGACRFLLLPAIAAFVTAGKAQTPVPDRMQVLYAANSLDAHGHQPFHPEMTFQLYDLSGKASEQGTVAFDATARGTSHRVVHAPSLKENGAPLQEDSPLGRREAYLVEYLTGIAMHPMAKPKPATEDIPTVSRNFGKVVLQCASPHANSHSGDEGAEALYCTEPSKDALRLVSLPAQHEAITRNSIGLFRDTHVALDVELSLLGRIAISGKITTLKSIDPVTPGTLPGGPATATPDAASEPLSPAPDGPPATIAGGVIAGARTKFVQPEYPLAAKASHLSGSVVLHAIIGKDGTIRRLVPIAVTDTVFTKAATDAVSRWTYRPYLLNGQPTDVDTTITVNFALGQR